ncbi:hypothetical protein CHS0354_021776 [Potamilus streckersoni]|uniref:Uncharacterized protein n=1 Tax=Potamilus streckersoni TaxID=2493646 RepID=A0AAE0S4G9_9BIVA|nr:hypothetical protein CHS0354_021776 [Potamilus streckersoni]
MADSPDHEVVFRFDIGESEAGQGDVIYEEDPGDVREDSREHTKREGHEHAMNNIKQDFNDVDRFYFYSRPSMQPTPYSRSDDWDDIRQQNRSLSRLEARKRQSGESIAVLGDSLRQMAQKTYSNFGAVAQKAIGLNQLYKAISIEMKCKCINRECKTVAEAVDVIERCEAVSGNNNNTRMSSVRG